MHAPHLSTLARTLRRLLGLFQRPAPAPMPPAPAAAKAAPVMRAPAPAKPPPPSPPRQPQPARPTAVLPTRPAEPPTPSWPAATGRSIRSLDEVRADLARLRESSKQRHTQADAQVKVQARARMQAQLQAQPAIGHDTGFAPTDFMDMTHLDAAPKDAAHTDFAPTDILAFAPAHSTAAATPADKPAPAVVPDDFLDFSAFKPPGR